MGPTAPSSPARSTGRKLIFLTGFMGSGKSTIGPILANTLGYDFVDVDRLIEAKAHARVVQIFERDGEQRFRELEHEVLQEVAARDHCIVSLGGGTIANEQNFSLIRENGIIVYLRLEPDEIYQRVHHRPDRPLLWDASGNLLSADQLQERIRQLLADRERYYNQADVVVPSDRRRVGVTVDEIVRRLRGYV
ncbi:MAG: shikimate kinase [Bacteroidetes bacterium]|jgi:shikimate kinase|nr:shikimate kinase [Bacteroidota bacterium]